MLVTVDISSDSHHRVLIAYLVSFRNGGKDYCFDFLPVINSLLNNDDLDHRLKHKLVSQLKRDAVFLSKPTTQFYLMKVMKQESSKF